MTISNSLVSILMPVFNEQKYISEAIESILSQTYSNFELIIIDDGSTDKTSKIVKKYSDQRIQLYQPGKIGKVAAFNLAFSKSFGDFICLFAGDDILPKDSIEERMGSIKNCLKGPAISFCKIKTFSEIKKFDGIIIPKGDKGNLSGGAMIFNRLFSDVSFPIPSKLANEDKWLVLHALYLKGIFVEHITFIGCYFRIHQDNSSIELNSFSEKNESMHRRFKVYKVFLDRYKNRLDKNASVELSAQNIAESLRYNGKWISILFMRGLNVKRKLKFIMYSNSFFYGVRMRAFSLFSGWGN